MPHNFEDLADGTPTERFRENAERSPRVFDDAPDLESEAARVQDLVMKSCRESVAEHGDFRPVVAALIGLDLQLFHPEWSNEHEKGREFHHLNKYLTALDPSISVAALPGQFGVPGEMTPCIILTTRTRAWKSMVIYPYQLTDDEAVEWLEPVEPEDFTTNAITVPSAD